MYIHTYVVMPSPGLLCTNLRICTYLGYFFSTLWAKNSYLLCILFKYTRIVDSNYKIVVNITWTPIYRNTVANMVDSLLNCYFNYYYYTWQRERDRIKEGKYTSRYDPVVREYSIRM